jgi:hypothetical protein
MPQIIHTDFKKLLFELFNGSATRPTTIYAGLRTNTPSGADTLASVSEIVGGGYARVALTGASAADSVSGNDWKIIIPVQTFAAFTSAPTTNGATHWFLCSPASGATGNLYASGPLNPAVVAGTLSAASASGSNVISVLTSIASSLNVNDFLNLGTVCGSNLALVQVSSFGTASGGNTPITLSAALSAAHPNGEAFNRDGSTRVYVAGYQESVSITLLLTQG